MADEILRFTGEELRRAGATMNPLDVLAQELAAHGFPGAAAYRCTLTPWTPAAVGPDPGPGETLVLCELNSSGERSLMPAEVLRLLGAAALTALAVRELLGPGLITACVLGSGLAAELQLALNTQYIGDISHVAVWPGTAGETGFDPQLLDQLEFAGTRLFVASSVEQALFGANLVIVTGDVGPGRIDAHLVKGALLVNAAGRALPDGFAAGAAVRIVDDAGLLAGSTDPRRYLDVGAATSGDVRRRRPADADLGQVVAGLHPGRPHLDAIIVVELLSTGLLILPLAGRLHETARRLGLGRPVG
jgi:ornithine cyclodeaminase/alanine dehydrogenase-like protein (mu-crystallin family)